MKKAIKKGFLWGVLCCILLLCSAITVSAATPEEELPYEITEGATYYESAWGFGSGRYDTVTAENPYTIVPCYAGRDGYAFLDASGHVIDSKYCPEVSDIMIPEPPAGTVELFVHFHTGNYRNGWTSSTNLSPRADAEQFPTDASEVGADTGVVPEEQTPEEIIGDISQELEESASTTAIVIDYSGSMADNQREVVKLLGTLPLDSCAAIVVFAESYEFVTMEQLISEDFNVGASTHMYQALNAVTSCNVESLIIISDLATYGDVALATCFTVKDVTIYDPDGSDFLTIPAFKDAWPNANIERIQIAENTA